jgi:preprotein translocase SecE subunit
MNRYRKWVDLFLALCGVALWFLLRQMLSQVWEIFRLPVFSDWPVQPPSVVALALALAAFAWTKSNKRAMDFLDEVSQELSKVTWPNLKETVASTGVIIVMVGIAAGILFLFDTLWGTLTKSFLAL